jgi:hypothetical protein
MKVDQTGSATGNCFHLREGDTKQNDLTLGINILKIIVIIFVSFDHTANTTSPSNSKSDDPVGRAGSVVVCLSFQQYHCLLNCSFLIN